jgi:hypothetical protein
MIGTPRSRDREKGNHTCPTITFHQRLAEEALQLRDEHREALEAVRAERERLRDVGEMARVHGEEAESPPTLPVTRRWMR